MYRLNLFLRYLFRPERSRRESRFATKYRWTVIAVLSAGALNWAVANAADPSHVLIVLSQHSAPYEEAAQALTADLSAKAPLTEIRRADWNDLASLRGPSDIIVAIGGEAADSAAANAPKVPILNLLVPRRMHERIAERHQRRDFGRYSVVFLDQPPARQIELIRLAFPGRASIGVLLGPESAYALPELQAACAERNLSLNPVQAHGVDDLPDALKKLTGDADVLLTLPDPALLNSASARNILIFAYRVDMPVVAFSPTYVSAGAMLALYSTPQQMGRQGAAAILHWLQGRNLPPPQYARDFEIGINAAVARSLNFALEPASSLADKLRRGAP